MNIKTINFVAIIISCSFLCLPVNQAKSSARVIAGWVERVYIESQPYEIKAKLDTGAKTSSIYATNVEPFQKNGKRWARFTLQLSDSEGKKHKLTLEKPRSRKVKIKNHDGKHDQRYVVDLNICFNGRNYITEFTLSDRSEYIYGILLGRQFLKHTALVDSEKTYLTSPGCTDDTPLGLR